MQPLLVIVLVFGGVGLINVALYFELNREAKKAKGWQMPPDLLAADREWVRHHLAVAGQVRPEPSGAVAIGANAVAMPAPKAITNTPYRPLYRNTCMACERHFNDRIHVYEEVC